MEISFLFNRRSTSVALAAVTALTAATAWSCWMHDRQLRASFLDEVDRNPAPRLLTIQTDGVTREGYLSRGAAMPNISVGFYNHPSHAFVVAASPEATCWYTNMRVVAGSDNLPLWQKIVGGDKYEASFDNPVFSNWLSYNCAPVAGN